ncbi:hypothetical protein V6N11_046780 [Hibiscus sabdariffa]|uniref:Uncharacterized protein n=1 Tax=Hibiscus sabdariffa TaxID=183260 RepID=A0ABR2NGG4_9ROSI
MPQSKADQPVKRIVPLRLFTIQKAPSIDRSRKIKKLIRKASRKEVARDFSKESVLMSVKLVGFQETGCKSQQSSQVSGEDGYNVSFMSKLMGNGSSKLRTDAYSSSDASSRDGACHPAHL